ncbi:MAG: response regulator [Elusimicrobia bacterium]|nr:response regulator [Elusimicrobiota bacterium]
MSARKKKKAPVLRAPKEKPVIPSQADATELLTYLSVIVFDDVFWMLDLQSGRALYATPGCERTLGVTQEQMLADARAWLENVDPDDREVVVEAMRAKEYKEFQVRIQWEEGPRWIRCRTYPVKDASNTPYRLVAVAEDITERRETQEALKTSQAELLQAQKMEAVGRLAGGVAHDFNNILTVILGYAEHILEQMQEEAKWKNELHQVKRAGERAASLTRQLLAFSRKQRLNPKLLRLNAIVSDMERMLRRLIGDDIEVTLKLSAELPPVHIDAGQLEQVVMNLCVNARDAMDGPGKLLLETEPVMLDGPSACGRFSVPAGRWVRLTVQDTGCGMDASVLDKIFEPFFTTKEAGKGTGLGLATTMGIVKQSGGHITVESEKGKGTTFKIYLPQADGVVEDAPAAADGGKSLRGSETVLLLEDEKPVRDLLRQTLSEAGYRVLEAGSPGEALWLCERHHGAIQLLISDIVMRQMSGYDVAEKLEPLVPGLRILFMSGYSDRPVPERWAKTPFLNKPFPPITFLEAVRTVLDEPRPPAEPPEAEPEPEAESA